MIILKIWKALQKIYHKHNTISMGVRSFSSNELDISQAINVTHIVTTRSLFQATAEPDNHACLRYAHFILCDFVHKNFWMNAHMSYAHMSFVFAFDCVYVLITTPAPQPWYQYLEISWRWALNIKEELISFENAFWVSNFGRLVTIEQFEANCSYVSAFSVLQFEWPYSLILVNAHPWKHMWAGPHKVRLFVGILALYQVPQWRPMDHW